MGGRRVGNKYGRLDSPCMLLLKAHGLFVGLSIVMQEGMGMGVRSIKESDCFRVRTDTSCLCNLEGCTTGHMTCRD
jgi:hypothetical protein